MYDVVVIGGGVCGAMILRELSSYRLKICMAEKEKKLTTLEGFKYMDLPEYFRRKFNKYG